MIGKAVFLFVGSVVALSTLANFGLAAVVPGQFGFNQGSSREPIERFIAKNVPNQFNLLQQSALERELWPVNTLLESK